MKALFCQKFALVYIFALIALVGVAEGCGGGSTSQAPTPLNIGASTAGSGANPVPSPSSSPSPTPTPIPGTVSVSGAVQGLSGDGLSGITVVIVNTNQSAISIGSQFIINNVLPGLYMLDFYNGSALLDSEKITVTNSNLHLGTTNLSLGFGKQPSGTATVSGTVSSPTINLSAFTVVIVGTNQQTTPDGNGGFMITNVPAGTFTLNIYDSSALVYTAQLTVPTSGNVNVGTITVTSVVGPPPTEPTPLDIQLAHAKHS
jgi:hypothetical protein